MNTPGISGIHVDSNYLTVAVSSVAILTTLGLTYRFFNNSHHENDLVRGKLRCHCGKVEAIFCAPKTTPVAACHCEDCVAVIDWAKTCKQCNQELINSYGGVEMVQMYKQDIQWMQGCEYLQRIRLRLNAPLERFYTTCCGTPIGFTSATLKIFPFFVVYRDLLVSSNEVDFNPVGYRLNVAKIPIAQRIWRRKQDSAMESEGVSVAFIMKLLTRMMYGIMVGKNEPDPTACIANSGHVEILQPNSAPK